MTRSQESSSPASDFLDKNKHDKQILIVVMDLTLLRLGVCRGLCDEISVCKTCNNYGNIQHSFIQRQ